MMTRIIALVGKAGVGKTTLANELAALLGWPCLSIDTERTNGGDFNTLATKIRLLRTPAISESVAMPKPYRHALREHQTSVVLVTCDETTRQQRVADRPPMMRGGRAYANPLATIRIDMTNAEQQGNALATRLQLA